MIVFHLFRSSMDCAHELLASSKRNLLVIAVPAAVSDLAECCEIFSKTCGEAADECTEAYYYYGKALLGLSRLENGVFGNVLEGVDVDVEDKMNSNDHVEDPEKMSKDEMLEVEKKVANALEENFKQHDKVDTLARLERLVAKVDSGALAELWELAEQHGVEELLDSLMVRLRDITVDEDNFAGLLEQAAGEGDLQQVGALAPPLPQAIREALARFLAAARRLPGGPAGPGGGRPGGGARPAFYSAGVFLIRRHDWRWGAKHWWRFSC